MIFAKIDDSPRPLLVGFIFRFCCRRHRRHCCRRCCYLSVRACIIIILLFLAHSQKIKTIVIEPETKFILFLCVYLSVCAWLVGWLVVRSRVSV